MTRHRTLGVFLEQSSDKDPDLVILGRAVRTIREQQSMSIDE
ncbi:MAG: hypothetical protein WBV77_04745 [Solirubrobacteraceae bacterium]